ncbi:CatB-related O-acetyltransferase [Sphingomonas sp. HT-1]|uniref:CatB-related O-acetyltransferase n=1 Tax=unclassified Sphingomonas TaxID=196159 RepID=UPI0002F00E80|nr:MULTISPECIES: CatB-related O-acetyltransferase [unclassified Sphingomonas]KTF67418.1 chloramphenicol acetyltransferase [Sphingomonas sp. WG]
MGIQSTIDRVLLKLVRNHEESALLRSRFRKLYRIEIGEYSYGAFDRWRIPPGTQIGRYCSFAGSALIISANHPMQALSTHPIFYLKARGVIDRDRVVAQPTIVEDDVWIGHHAIITPGCKRIGRGAVIGAGAVVTRDVAPYAIVAGNPAKLIRYRFAPEVIDALERTRWWELDRTALARACAQVPAFALEPTVENAAAFERAVAAG